MVYSKKLQIASLKKPPCNDVEVIIHFVNIPEAEAFTGHYRKFLENLIENKKNITNSLQMPRIC